MTGNDDVKIKSIVSTGSEPKAIPADAGSATSEPTSDLSRSV